MMMEALNAFKRINKLNLYELKQHAWRCVRAQCAYIKLVGWLAEIRALID